MTIQDLLDGIELAENENSYIISTKDVKRHLQEIQKEQLRLHGVSNWVACKDALPKHETDVICYCLDFEVRVGRKTGNYWFIDGYSLPQDITHWQELPKPPCY